ncbi:MAG: DUF2330 domain-containing protein [Polyangiaceae bacterium]
MRPRWLFAAAALPCVLLSHPRQADACGGCFPPPPQMQSGGPSVVTGHRMVLSISNERTVLWDQIQYSGDPQDFAWVLPVGPGAVLEASNDAWFEALDAVTSTRVSSPPLFCSGGSGFSGGGSDGSCSGFACGASDSAGDGDSGSGDFQLDPDPDDGVDVLHEGTVGPYETVTLHAEDGDSLQSWLTDNGYDLPPDIEPVIDAYVAEGADFIALRLAPGQGVRQMTPVRVVTPGASTILPLRMVAAGTGSSVSIVLYVFGEGRYDTQSHPRADVDVTELRWDWEAEESNWAELREDALSGGGFLTTYAQSDALRVQDVLPSGEVVTYRDSNGSPQPDLASLYFAQAGANDGGASADCSSAIYALGTNTEVAESCPDGDEGCTQEPGTTDAAVFTCDGHDDLSAALIGMRPQQVWVTARGQPAARRAVPGSGAASDPRRLRLQPAHRRGDRQRALRPGPGVAGHVHGAVRAAAGGGPGGGRCVRDPAPAVADADDGGHRRAAGGFAGAAAPHPAGRRPSRPMSRAQTMCGRVGTPVRWEDDALLSPEPRPPRRRAKPCAWCGAGPGAPLVRTLLG